MKKSLNILQLQIISWNSGILRACNSIPFSIANKINSNGLAAEAALKAHNEFLTERTAALAAITDEDERAAALLACEADAAGALYDVELSVFPVSAFESLDISGEKDYPRQDGSIIKLSYREAFFHLVEFIVAE